MCFGKGVAISDLWLCKVVLAAVLPSRLSWADRRLRHRGEADARRADDGREGGFH